MICEKTLGKWQSKKHQNFVSPPRQWLHWQNLFDITILELWSLLKAYTFQGKLGKFWQISTQLLNNYPSLIPQLHERELCMCSGAFCTHLARAWVSDKDPIFQIAKSHVLVTYFCFSSQRCGHRDGHPLLLHLISLS